MKKTLIYISLVVSIYCMQEYTALPWWAFAILLVAAGILIPLKRLNIRPFLFGFAIGFTCWLLPTLFIHFNSNGKALRIVSDLFELPEILVLLISGLIGGAIGGLAILTGYQLKSGKEQFELKLDHHPHEKNKKD